MMTEFQIEGFPAIEFQDGGQAMVAEISGPGPVFIRLQSWDEAMAHGLLKQLTGDVANAGRGQTVTGVRKLRVTVEVI